MPILLFTGAGSVVILGSAALLCHILIHRDRKRLGQIGAFLTLIRYIKNRIDCYSEPIDTILTRCDASLLSACGQKAPMLVDRADFSSFLAGCEVWLSESEGQILYDFSGELGRGYRAEQVKVCEYYLARLDRAREELEDELPNRCKLIRTVAFSAALGLILVLI